MTQIDLISNEWSDLLFSIIAVLILFAIAMAFMVAKNAIDDYRAKNMPHTQVVELTPWNDKKTEPKVERVEPIREEKIEQIVEKVKSSIKFIAPIIKKDSEVDPKDEMKTQEEIMSSKVAVGFANVIGNDESADVLRSKTLLVTEPVKPKEEESTVFEYVEQMPSFPGGDAALMRYLSKNIKYPPLAEENGIQGRVICSFVVERDGSVSDIRIKRSVDPSLDKEAMRVVSAMPKWIPGRQNGQMVRVKYTLPVTFRLQ